MQWTRIAGSCLEWHSSLIVFRNDLGEEARFVFMLKMHSIWREYGWIHCKTKFCTLFFSCVNSGCNFFRASEAITVPAWNFSRHLETIPGGEGLHRKNKPKHLQVFVSFRVYKIHYSHSVFHVLHPLVPFQALYYSTQMTVLDKDPPAMQKDLFQDNSVPIWGVRSAARTASNGWHKACSTNSTARMHRFWVWLVVFILSLSTILCIVAMPLSLMAVGSIHLLTGIQNRRAANLSSKRLHHMNLP